MKKLENKIAVAYCRGKVGGEQMNNLLAQRTKITSFSNKKGLIIDKFFEEDYSAKTFNRPSFKELKKYVLKNKNRIDYILVHSWDRFARDIEGALKQIRYFESIGVEVNSVENWINFNDPTQFLLFVLYMTMPEAENKVRALKVKEGIRKANLMGRWVNMQPKGYAPGRDVNFKPLMKPHPTKGELVTKLFNEFSLGVKPQSEFLIDLNYKDLKLTKNNLSRMLKQIAYTGRIRVSAFEKTPEQIVDALHQPLISIDVFNKVQDILTV
jgi:site-specific DNA recombinase